MTVALAPGGRIRLSGLRETTCPSRLTWYLPPLAPVELRLPLHARQLGGAGLEQVLRLDAQHLAIVELHCVPPRHVVALVNLAALAVVLRRALQAPHRHTRPVRQQVGPLPGASP